MKKLLNFVLSRSQVRPSHIRSLVTPTRAFDAAVTSAASGPGVRVAGTVDIRGCTCRSPGDRPGPGPGPLRLSTQWQAGRWPIAQCVGCDAGPGPRPSLFKLESEPKPADSESRRYSMIFIATVARSRCRCGTVDQACIFKPESRSESAGPGETGELPVRPSRHWPQAGRS